MCDRPGGQISECDLNAQPGADDGEFCKVKALKNKKVLSPEKTHFDAVQGHGVPVTGGPHAGQIRRDGSLPVPRPGCFTALSVRWLVTVPRGSRWNRRLKVQPAPHLAPGSRLSIKLYRPPAAPVRLRGVRSRSAAPHTAVGPVTEPPRPATPSSRLCHPALHRESCRQHTVAAPRASPGHSPLPPLGST